ncbi:MAG: TIGR01777 family oxidoreductase [Chloroflexota bacterium]
MNVLISGAHGLIGRALTAKLQAGGHAATALSRSPRPDEISWDFDGAQLEAFDAVVHLAGESIASGRWTAAKKAAILESRVSLTTKLSEALAMLERPPRTLIVASAIGFYGDRPGEVLDEGSSSGDGFLAEVCRQWEAAAEPARAAGIRVAHSRFGIVLSPHGGALKPLLAVFKLGLGGPIGSGRQMWSWIALEDVASALVHVLVTDNIAGPINFTAPSPLPERDFATVLGRVLRRPAFTPLPAFAARLVLGEMANELLLSDQNVRPTRLLDSGYSFAFTDLEAALPSML